MKNGNYHWVIAISHPPFPLSVDLYRSIQIYKKMKQYKAWWKYQQQRSHNESLMDWPNTIKINVVHYILVVLHI